jgi:2-polyprenyl-6-methoxyphenol hydroxylase-like FAD-dependent oxidoreductase
MDLHLAGRVVRATLGDFALPDTPYPFLVLIRQSDLEEILRVALNRHGIDVEYGCAVRGYVLRTGRPTALVHTATSRTEVAARFLVGCDGGASQVRRTAGIGFNGVRYPTDIVLADLEPADLEAAVPHGTRSDDVGGHTAISARGLVMLLPLGESATWRLIASIAATSGRGTDDPFGPEVPRDVLDGLLRESGLPFRITAAAWSSRVRVHHRLAARYRSGPVLLAGDAAHRFSPAGGQGMNTGIQDACALGWRLALAARSPGRTDLLLDSYESERRQAARGVLALTHALFWLESGADAAARSVNWVGAGIARKALPRFLGHEAFVAPTVRVVSQLSWAYHLSPLSLDLRRRSPMVRQHADLQGRPGHRLPDADVSVGGLPRRLHDITATPGFHVLLPGNSAALAVNAMPGPHIPVTVHRVDSWSGARAFVVRPDGYIGYRGPVSELGSWFNLVDGSMPVSV